MFIFGKHSLENKPFFVDLNTFEWRYLENISYKCYGHTANLIDKDIYLFGGYY